MSADTIINIYLLAQEQNGENPLPSDFDLLQFIMDLGLGQILGYSHSTISPCPLLSIIYKKSCSACIVSHSSIMYSQDLLICYVRCKNCMADDLGGEDTEKGTTFGWII